jgi:hypothetical protein
MTGAHTCRYGLMLATYKDRDPAILPSSQSTSADGQVSGTSRSWRCMPLLPKKETTCLSARLAGAPPFNGSPFHALQAVYIMSMEMDGAGACSGLLCPDDRILEVDGEPAESLQQVRSSTWAQCPLCPCSFVRFLYNHLKLPCAVSCVQVTNAFRESRDTVRVKVSSKVRQGVDCPLAQCSVCIEWRSLHQS